MLSLVIPVQELVGFVQSLVDMVWQSGSLVKLLPETWKPDPPKLTPLVPLKEQFPSVHEPDPADTARGAATVIVAIIPAATINRTRVERDITSP